MNPYSRRRPRAVWNNLRPHRPRHCACVRCDPPKVRSTDGQWLFIITTEREAKGPHIVETAAAA